MIAKPSQKVARQPFYRSKSLQIFPETLRDAETTHAPTETPANLP